VENVLFLFATTNQRWDRAILSK